MVDTPTPTGESIEKVTGTAQYIVDFTVPGMAYGKILRSPFAHAKIVNLETAAARRVPGVYCVLTREDFHDGRIRPYYGEPIEDQPVVAIDRARFDGNPVAAVAAASEGAAMEALGLIDVEYEELPEVMDPVEAMQPGAVLLHDPIPVADEFRSHIRPVAGTNICHRFVLECGDVEQGFKEADYVFEDIFIMPPVAHHALEPHACIAHVQESGIQLWTNSQNPFHVRKATAHMFRLPQEKVRVTVPFVGGAFGAKSGDFKLEPIALALSWKAGRPVKIVARADETAKIVTRHGSRIKVKSGVKKDGRLTARTAEIVVDTGAYATSGPWVAYAASEGSTGVYSCPNIRVVSNCVYTNKTPAGAYRGFGKTQATHAWEIHMDRIARELRMDPLELRRKNLLAENGIHPLGDRVEAAGLRECLDQVAEAIHWRDRPGKTGQRQPSGGKLRGKGLAVMVKTPPPLSPKPTMVSEVKLRLDQDGKLTVLYGTVNMGQGSDTVMAHMAAASTGLPPDQIQVVHSDTGLVPYDLATYGSRSTFHMGAAIEEAGRKLKSRLREIAAGFVGVSPGGVEPAAGRISAGKQSLHEMTVAEIVRRHGGAIEVLGSCTVGGPIRTPEGEFPNHATYWTWCAAAAEVEVDPETGEVIVLSYAHACDVGKAISRIGCEGQMEGAAVMSLGSVLFEELVWEKGQLLNAGLIDYPLPRARNQPHFITKIVERPHDRGGFGAKGLGDAMPVVTPAAVVNAVYDATGVLIPQLPLRPDRVHAALKERG